MELILKKYGCIKNVLLTPPAGGVVWIYEKTSPLEKYEEIILYQQIDLKI